MTHDPKRANRLAPLDAAPHVTDTMHDTELVFGAIMSGSVVTPKPGLIPAEVVATMLRLMGGKVQQIAQRGGVGTPEDIQGLQVSAQYTDQFIAQLAQDKANNQLVKQFSDGLGQIMNMVKAFAQRLQEAMQKRQQQQGNGMNPETMQKLMANMAMAKQKMQVNQDKFQQKMEQNDQKFVADQQRKNVKTMADIHDSAMATTMEPPQIEPPKSMGESES